jgi:glycosyltransferase involved in cell wall biosynthesis
MFVYNRCTTDVRVLREAATLQAAGHEVSIVAVLDATTAAREQLPNGIRILRIDRRPLHYRLAWWVRGRRRALRLGARRLARNVLHLLLSPFAETAVGDAIEEAAAEHGVEPVDALKVILAPTLPLFGLLALVSRIGHRVLYAFHKPLMYTDFWGRGYRRVARAGFDVFHAHDLNTLPVAALLAHHTGARLVYDAHELYPEVSTLSPLESWVWRRVEPRLIWRADRVLTVCDSIAGELSDRYRVVRPQVLLNCPPSTDAVDPRESPLRAAAGLDGDGDTRLILYQGGFAPNRGLPELVLSMRELDDALLVLMGWGRLEEELAELIRAQHLDERVRMLPPVHRDQLQLWTAGADIGAIPYQPVGLNNTYSTPNKLFEYLAASVPIVATRLPEIARIVDGHGIGVTFPRVEPSEIAAATGRLLRDPAERSAMRARARAIRDQYTWEHQAEKLQAVYEGLT